MEICCYIYGYIELTEHEKIIYGLKQYPRFEDVELKRLIGMPLVPSCEVQRLDEAVNELQK